MSSSPSSILFLIPGFPEDEADTTCLPAVQNYVAAFARAHPEIQTHVIAFQYPFVQRTYAWKGATVHALGGRNRRGLRRLVTWLRAARTVRRLRRATAIQTLHSFWLTECTWVARFLSRRFRIRHVASIGGQDARADNPYFAMMNLDGMLLTAGSSFAAETLSTHVGRSVDYIIPLGLDTEHLQQITTPAARDIDILGVGSLIPVKDYATFIEVVAGLVPAFPHVRACIVGEGPLQETLQQQITERGLANHITLTGRVPRDEAFRYMLRSQVFLHTAQYEGQGYVFLEALFAGLPVVCFDVGHPGTSDRVFRCDTAQAMINTVTDLLRMPPSYHQPPVPSAQDTVQAFEPLYGLSEIGEQEDRSMGE